MIKAIRNTLFTLIAVGLTAMGLSWNRGYVEGREPLLPDNPIISTEKSTDLDITIPLTVTVKRPIVKVNQFQEIEIATAPGAVLEVITTYPNGSINNPQTMNVVADSSGKYVYKYKLENVEYLGKFETQVNATLDGKTASVTKRFLFQKWGKTETPLPDELTGQYYYPIVP